MRIYSCDIRFYLVAGKPDMNDTQSVNIGRHPAGKHRRDVSMIGKTKGFFVTFFTRWQAHGRK